jgi:hypothetical protein
MTIVIDSGDDTHDHGISSVVIIGDRNKGSGGFSQIEQLLDCYVGAFGSIRNKPTQRTCNW